MTPEGSVDYFFTEIRHLAKMNENLETSIFLKLDYTTLALFASSDLAEDG